MQGNPVLFVLFRQISAGRTSETRAAMAHRAETLRSPVYRSARRAIIVNFVVPPGNISMPKLKTHKGASKRFKKTGSGKFIRSHAFGRHILTSKPHKRKKKLHEQVVVDPTNHPVLLRMLPY